MDSITWDIKEVSVLVGGNIAGNYKAICRDDNQQILHISKKGYTPTSNQKFMETTLKLAEITGFTHSGYTEFDKGRKMLAFLKNTEKIKVCDWECDDYMLVGNSHDGTTAFFVGSTNVMIRCQNQFTASHKKMKAYHKSNNEIKINEILEYFELYQESKRNMISTMEKMEKVKIDTRILEGMIANVLNIQLGKQECLGDIQDILSTRKKNIISEVEHSIAIETEALGDNLFGLFNGITHWTTHKKEGAKVFGNCLGTNAALNRKAWEFSQKVMA